MNFTTLFINQNRQVYYLSYDYGFLPIIQKGIPRVLIISRQRYMETWDPWKYVKKDTPDNSDPAAKRNTEGN